MISGDGSAQISIDFTILFQKEKNLSFLFLKGQTPRHPLFYSVQTGLAAMILLFLQRGRLCLSCSWTEEVSPIYPVASRFRLRTDFRDIARKSSSSNCCFLNLKYSSIRHLIRYTFVTMWHRRFFSRILRLLKSSMGLSRTHIRLRGSVHLQETYTALQVYSSFYTGHLYHFYF